MVMLSVTTLVILNSKASFWNCHQASVSLEYQIIYTCANLRVLFLVFNATEWKHMFGFIQNSRLTMKQSQMPTHEPYMQEDIPKGIARLVDWIKFMESVFILRRGTAQLPL